MGVEACNLLLEQVRLLLIEVKIGEELNKRYLLPSYLALYY